VFLRVLVDINYAVVKQVFFLMGSTEGKYESIVGCVSCYKCVGFYIQHERVLWMWYLPVIHNPRW
jgi:hypothetical protein